MVILSMQAVYKVFGPFPSYYKVGHETHARRGRGASRGVESPSCWGSLIIFFPASDEKIS
jgi:hypothetical protein